MGLAQSCKLPEDSDDGEDLILEISDDDSDLFDAINTQVITSLNRKQNKPTTKVKPINLDSDAQEILLLAAHEGLLPDSYVFTISHAFPSFRHELSEAQGFDDVFYSNQDDVCQAIGIRKKKGEQNSVFGPVFESSIFDNEILWKMQNNIKDLAGNDVKLFRSSTVSCLAAFKSNGEVLTWPNPNASAHPEYISQNSEEINELPIIIGNYVNTIKTKDMDIKDIYRDIHAFAGQKRNGTTTSWEILRGYGISGSLPDELNESDTHDTDCFATLKRDEKTICQTWVWDPNEMEEDWLEEQKALKEAEEQKILEEKQILEQEKENEEALAKKKRKMRKKMVKINSTAEIGWFKKSQLDLLEISSEKIPKEESGTVVEENVKKEAIVVEEQSTENNGENVVEEQAEEIESVAIENEEKIEKVAEAEETKNEEIEKTNNEENVVTEEETNKQETLAVEKERNNTNKEQAENSEGNESATEQNDEEKKRIAEEGAKKEISEEEEEEKKRIAEEEAEKERIAQEEAEKKRIAEEEAEKKRIAEEEAEKKRIAEEEAKKKRIAEKKRKEEREKKKRQKERNRRAIKMEETLSSWRAFSVRKQDGTILTWGNCRQAGRLTSLVRDLLATPSHTEI